jgi:sigma-54 dependent transcriptional regulator, acetoin dehydrogenase operon transcriptional activator AcoR
MGDELKHNQMRAAWESFVSEHHAQAGIPPLIAQSWERCWPILSPDKSVRLKKLSADHLLSTQVSNFDLLSIARPIMEDIYQYIEGTHSALAPGGESRCQSGYAG